MNMIPRVFIDYAAEILGETDGGLSGSQIAKHCLSYAIDMNVAIPYSSYPFPSDLPNKRTALRDNLLAFSPEQQYKIIRDLCDLDKFKENKKVEDLKFKLISQYDHLAAKRKSDKVAETLVEPRSDYETASTNKKNNSVIEKDADKNELPTFPDIIPSSIVESRFRLFEAGDFKTKEDLDELIELLFEEPECAFYYFSEKGQSITDVLLREAKEKGDVLMNETHFFYYRHPKFTRDYVKIEARDGKFEWAWQKDVVEKGPMFVRTTLKLSQRKRTELETLKKIILEKNYRRQHETTDNYLPQNPWQAFLHIFWPLRGPWRKSAFILTILLIAIFTVWTTLPEKSKVEILNYIWRYGFESRSPELTKPANGESFNHYPRTTVLEWKRLPDAVRYLVEVELQDVKTGIWHPIPSGKNRQGVEGTTTTINFTGGQPGRWRVIAINEYGVKSRPSEWWEFFYTQ